MAIHSSSNQATKIWGLATILWAVPSSSSPTVEAPVLRQL